MIDGYTIQEDTLDGWRDFAAYGMDEPAARDACRWYNRRLRARRLFRLVLRTGPHLAVIRG